MIHYWTIRRLGGHELTFDNYRVLSSKKYYTIKEIEDKYEGWVVIGVDTQPKKWGGEEE
jgi:hypothetical protein